MFDKLRKVVWPVLAAVFCLTLSRPVFSQDAVAGQAMTAEQLVAGMSQKWSNIQDFQSDLSVGMQMFGKMMNIKGTIWQKDKLFRAEMTLPPEVMPGADKSADLRMLMVFDGKTMWQSMPMMNMVMKTDFASLEGKIKNMPFSKSPYSLPAVPYQLSEKNRNGSDYYFLETKDINKFIQNSPISGMGVNVPANMPFQDIGVWVNKTTLFPDLIEFYFQDKTPGMYVEFKNIKTGQGLAPSLFVFQVPEGAQVMDMTASMKAIADKAAKTQSTASDTGQASK